MLEISFSLVGWSIKAVSLSFYNGGIYPLREKPPLNSLRVSVGDVGNFLSDSTDKPQRAEDAKPSGAMPGTASC